jgi:hypothetical protein
MPISDPLQRILRGGIVYCPAFEAAAHAPVAHPMTYENPWTTVADSESASGLLSSIAAAFDITIHECD